jgi:hypothetical protein
MAPKRETHDREISMTPAFDGLCLYPAEADIRTIRGHSGFDPIRKSGGPKCCDAQYGLFNDVVGCDPWLEEST